MSYFYIFYLLRNRKHKHMKISTREMNNFQETLSNKFNKYIEVYNNEVS